MVPERRSAAVDEQSPGKRGWQPVLLTLLLCSLCQCAPGSADFMARPAPDEATQEARPTEVTQAASAVALTASGSTLLVPVTIDNVVQARFVLDSGASDVSVPEDIVQFLLVTGTLRSTDLLGHQTYRLADGSIVSAPTFRIRSVRVGNRIVENVTGSIAVGQRNFLLGQSLLSRFRSWSVDNERKLLVIE
jgi:predicted aspartyl protease